MRKCDPRDIAIKSLFLGPQTENGEWLRARWNQILESWLDWRQQQFPQDGSAITNEDQNSQAFKKSLAKLESGINSILRELEKETPKFSPRYIGHMVSEISLPALLGHACTLLHNPNLISRKVSKVVSRLEEEAIADLAKMVGYSPQARGHFTSGGTLANFEALWHAIVRQDQLDTTNSLLTLGPWDWAQKLESSRHRPFPGFSIMVPGNKHYSWEKAVMVMGLGARAFCSIALDEEGRLDPLDLKTKIDQANSDGRPILMVVSVAGTTELGEVDPIDRVQDVVDEYRQRGQKIWHHVDAAYGGYFTAMLDQGGLETKLSHHTAMALRAIGRADSVTLDPHKLGYVPYACGAFLVREESHYQNRQSSAAYLETNDDSRWMFTLEGSRSGSGAAATWLSNRVLGLDGDGYGRLLNKGLEARDILIQELKSRIPNICLVEPIDLNIVCLSYGPRGSRLSEINRISDLIWEHFDKSPNFSVSKTILRSSNYQRLLSRMAKSHGFIEDVNEWHKIRLVLMNPYLTSKETKTNYIREFVRELIQVISSLNHHQEFV